MPRGGWINKQVTTYMRRQGQHAKHEITINTQIQNNTYSHIYIYEHCNSLHSND